MPYKRKNIWKRGGLSHKSRWHETQFITFRPSTT